MSNGPVSRLNSWWGHHAPDLLAIVIVLILASTFVSGVGAYYQAGTAAILFVLVVITWFQMRRHDRRPCERCISKMPLNPGEVAKKHQRHFAVVHSGDRKGLVVGYLLLLIGSDVLIVAPLGLPTVLNYLLLGFWAIMQGSMLYLLRAYVAHHRLQPWCPWCSGGDGKDEDVDAPDPVPSGGVLA